ncbi:protein DpdG [Variovorax robiniae]|uniref:Protein DpdG n=1 Tax=Variovorax robiniae TaxID=1836199 RepID=A0ABU8XJM1_9BURK
MTVLNLTSDGLPGILMVLHHTVLATSKPVPRTALLEAVAPTAALQESDPGRMARVTLNRWIELGLFQEKDGEITASARPPRKLSGPALTAFTRREVCRLSMSGDNTPDLWAIGSAKSADLTRGLAWMLAQNAFETRLSELEALEAQQVSNEALRLLQNDTRQNGLRHWADFLGFSRGLGGDIDPTVAVRDAIPEILSPGQDMQAVDFVDRLAEVLPVIDRGRWQKAVLQEVNADALAPLAPGQLSTAISRALLGLRAGGELLLQNRADVGASISLTGFSGPRPDLTFQWITRP